MTFQKKSNLKFVVNLGVFLGPVLGFLIGALNFNYLWLFAPFYLILIGFYFSVNNCSACGKFSRSKAEVDPLLGKLNIIYNTDGWGLFRPLILKECVNCGADLDKVEKDKQKVE